MRFLVRLHLSCIAALTSLVVAASPALADEPPASGEAPSPASPAPADVPADPSATLPPTAPPATPVALPPSAPPGSGADAPADPPTKEGDTRRAEGVRLGLDVGFQRAFDGASDRLNAGSPTLLPLGVDVSFRTSASVLVGLHGYAALASRDDCISDVDSCRARGYGFGAHIEAPLSRTASSFVPWIRYGMTYELLYQGGAPLDAEGHVHRGALDFLDLRIGGDFIVHRGSGGRTARIGPYLGLVGGFLVNQSGVTHLNGSGGRPRDLDRDSGSAHLWFTGGVRGTLDP